MANIKDDLDIYDYIVIGGGTSGAVAARRLAEGKDHYSVCLLEAGPSHEGLDNSRMPGGTPALFQQCEMFWGYDMVPQKGCNNRVLAASRGRFLGGCSGINGTVFTRGVKADYDRVAGMGNPGWSWNDMLPHFKASETFHPAEWHQADLSAHGTSGPLHTEPHPLAPISEKILESFIDQGFEYKPDMFVQGEYEGLICLCHITKY
ncbi:unnamed protein product [Rotaria sp. Silwood1]|nr:unnamed protein product [Rotaria sp. Silwood1]CAF1574381.1 unnamed protein product [Rotaria sp. Silwood1]CAF1574974.1 unnamed protein product [Rotaria sp. Silwood1]CAF3632701.1 unnamed protein product [Rotaria sp. Silwood1]CAF3686176.1 unnamed protein product [Rotaria sp. Silwood1]